MNDRPLWRWKRLLVTILFVSGCATGAESLTYVGDAELQYYKDNAQQIDYPDVDSQTAGDAMATDEPRMLGLRKKDEIWNLTLMEAIHKALANNRVIRSNGQFLSPGNGLYTNANQTASVYDPAIQETGVLFGGRGVEAALSDFDTTFATSMFWGKSEDVQNNFFFGGGLTPGGTLTQDTGNFRSALAKRFADGGSILVGHDWNYRGTNAPGQLFPSNYTGNLRAEYRRPLWAGAGVDYTRTAGPVNPNFGAITGVSQGVLIARINNDITIAQFEGNVRNLVKDVEDVYWDLYLQYRLYDTAVVARNSAQRTWSEAKTKLDIGGIRGFNKQDEAQARDQYYAAKAQAQSALSSIYTTETRLRRLLGLKVNDGRIIRPANEPTSGELVPDWRLSLTNALTRRVELRAQKWNIKSLELQLKAAESLTNPRFDFATSYQVNGFGDHLFGKQDNDAAGTPQGLRSGYETLTQGNQTAWTTGFEFSMPLGFRSAKAQVRNIELRLLKARKVLEAQELEISHELAVAFQNLAQHYANVKTNFERINAARERVRILEEQYKEGLANVTADIVLRAQSAQALAESAYYTSLSSYNQAIAELEFRKGSLLEHNSIFLAENEWTPAAYEDALRRAWARSHAFDNSRLLHTEPDEFVRQPIYSSGAYEIGNEATPMGNEKKPDGEVPAIPPQPTPAKNTGIDETPAIVPPLNEPANLNFAPVKPE